MKAWYATGLLIGIISVPYTAHLLGLGSNAAELGQSAGWTICWLIYFSSSKRVRRTFVANVPISRADYAAFATIAITVIAGAASLAVVGGRKADTFDDSAGAGVIAAPTITPVVSEDRWPAAFALTDADGKLPQASANDMSSGDQVIQDMANTYGFYLGQEWGVRGFGTRFPQYAEQLTDAEAKFDLRFKDSIENIDRILNAKFAAEWPKDRRIIQNGLETTVDFNSVTEGDATGFLKTLTDRSGGNIPSPQLQILLMFNPAYMANPYCEMADGFKKEFYSDGSVASDGARFSMAYPCSWRADSGQQSTNSIETFTNENGRGLSSVSVGVQPLPSESAQEIAKGSGVSDADLEQARQALVSQISGQIAQNAELRNTRTLDSGVATLGGHRAIWVEYTAEMNRVGIDIDFHNVSFLVLDGSRLLNINLSSGSGTRSKLTADEEYQRNSRLFQMMLNSLNVQDDAPLADVR